jgi:hypothetical protein
VLVPSLSWHIVAHLHCRAEKNGRVSQALFAVRKRSAGAGGGHDGIAPQERQQLEAQLEAAISRLEVLGSQLKAG